MLGLLRERAPAVTAVKASATEMPFDDGEFDLSFSVATMHHIADPDSVRLALAEMVRVVRPGGTVIVWDHNPRNPYWPYLMRRVPQDRGDERLVGVEELVDGLREGGAEPVSVEQLGMVPGLRPRAAACRRRRSRARRRANSRAPPGARPQRRRRGTALGEDSPTSLFP